MSENENGQGEALESDALDEESLDRVTGGAGGIAHELTHTVQQGSSVGANETITVGAAQTISVGSAQKP